MATDEDITYGIARKLAERRERTLERDIKLLKERNSDLQKRIQELEKQLTEKV